jgi:membrane-associated PAP2 superfamily phosphatase
MVRAIRMEKGLPALVYALIGVAVVTTAAIIAGFNVDIAISKLLFNPATGQFVGRGDRYLDMLRDHGFVAVATCVGCVVLAANRYLPWRLPSIPTRTAVVLTLSLLLGPGLLVNGILKEHWDRPRPFDVTEFGGTKPFVNWWNPNGSCERNCSFISGEAATAAWMFGPAMYLPPPWRVPALAAAAIFAGAMSVLRMAAGAHFFTDVLFGVLSTLLILLAMRAAADRWFKPAHTAARNELAEQGAEAPRARPTA